MFNNCSQCGRYSEEKHVDAAKSLAICPYCGYAETFSCFPLFVITGASGAGKTTDTTSTTVEETGLAVRKWLEGITLR
jgi:hypothetical protein